MSSPQRGPSQFEDPNLSGVPNPIRSASPEPQQPPVQPGSNPQAPKDNAPPALQLGSLLPAGELTGLQRSYYFSSNDRFDMEQYHQKPLTAPSTVEELLAEKVKVLNLVQNKTLAYSEMLGKLRIDGVYCDQDPQTYQKCTDPNILRLEQRILREKPYIDSLEATLMQEKKTNYFKMNGELKLHNDLLADEISRPQDLAFEQSEAYQTREQNAILCDRMHSYKKRYYRLHIVIGKIVLQSYPSFFSDEDRLALELKDHYREWERRTSLALIPFYMDRLKFMEDELYKRHREGGSLAQGDDYEFLKRNIEETQRKLELEKREVQEMAETLYKKWKQIKEIRRQNSFACTNLKLKVHKAVDGEFFFNLMHEEPSAKLFNGGALPSTEVSRRNNIVRIRAFIRLIINGHYVTRSKKAFLRWPNLELEVAEQFEVYLFTMPSSIQLEIVIGGLFQEQLIDVLNLEVPGSHVKALSSAATLIKDLSFSKRSFEKRRDARKIAKERSQMTEEQRAEAIKNEQKLEEETKNLDVNGVIYVKTEWKGEGPDMPPMRQENVFRQSQPQKNRKYYNELEQKRMLLRQLYIDVNDPRNETIIRLLKETKNEFLIKLLKEDSRIPVSHLKPFRHMLLDARSKDPDLAKKPIPMLEHEIIQDPILLDKLEVLFREQAYQEYLEKKIEEERVAGVQNKENDQRVYNMDLEDNAMKYDTECIRRRQMFFDKLKHFQREMQSGGNSKSSTQYKSIVREFELLESENPLLALFNKMFITGRKLKPVVQKRQPVSLEAVSEAKIMIHIIKGFNVPIRNVAKQDILSNFQGRNIGGTYNQMDPYSRTAGPYPSTINQLQQSMINNNMGMTGMGGMSGMGGNYDMRASMMGASMMAGGPGGYQSYNRMQGVNLNPGYNRGPHIQIGDIRQLNDQQLRSIYRIQRVEPMVEVRIVYNEDYSEVKVTNCAEGDFPEWNEILEFKLKSLNQKRFTRQELINTKSMIYITLFDVETIERGPNIQVIQTEKNFRYLGSFQIPLISLLNNPPKIDAIFKVDRPMALFNYQVETNTFFFLKQEGQQSIDQGNVLVEKKEVPNTYISMSISLDPVLELPQDNELEYYIGLEQQNLLSAASEWVKNLKKDKRAFEKRNIKLYGENVSGQSVLLCRYITAQNPPLDVYDPTSVQTKNDPYAIEKAARYVSLIPLIEDNQAFQGQLPDLWCTSQEFLDLGAGDVEEHAILLCNYFNYIDKSQGRDHIESYLALGLGYPEGKTAYVLRRDKNTNFVELWNALRGEAFNFERQQHIEEVLGCIPLSNGYKLNKRMNDAICQLKSIGCVISNENVWANVQDFDDPSLISFELNNTKYWKPFLTSANRSKYFPNDQPITSEQSSVLRYMKPMDKERADLIGIKIQSYITDQFERQRIKDNKMRTKWNNQMEATLGTILAGCEMKRKKARLGATHSSMRDKNQQDDDLNQQISAMQAKINENARGLKSWGFPVNVTFISLPMLWEEVKNTKLHLVWDDDAEFSLYVYVEPYSHNVMSVWFFLLVLTKDKRTTAATNIPMMPGGMPEMMRY